MKQLNRQLAPYNELPQYPERALQFGEGNFLRAFVDWMLHRLNEKGHFQGSVTVVQPISNGMASILNEQDGLFTLLRRGIKDGEVLEQQEVVHSISRGLNPYENFEDYLKCAENPELRFIFSNTTEAGIVYKPDDRLEDRPAPSFPGKLTQLLYHRFRTFQGSAECGLVIIPCELIDHNGDELKEIVLKIAEDWKLGEEFIQWASTANMFLNTLVDSIVTGYPNEEIAELEDKMGYKDKLLNTSELFHLWVIEGDKAIAEELPFHKIGLDVIWTDDLTRYRTRKVRILNGAHTMTVLAAYLYGVDTVKECMDDPTIKLYMKQGIFGNIIPTLTLELDELNSFSEAVLERFANPYIRHELLSIALNSVAKFKTRVLPSYVEFAEQNKELPSILAFSLAALIAFYRGTEIQNGMLIGNRNGLAYNIKDDVEILEKFCNYWTDYDRGTLRIEQMVELILKDQALWGEDLTSILCTSNLIITYLKQILDVGIKEAMEQVVTQVSVECEEGMQWE